MNIKEIFGGVKKEEEEKEKTPVSPFTSPKEKILAEGEFSEMSDLGGGTKEIYFVKVEGDGCGLLKKVLTKERASREKAAYIIDRFLGFNFVPTTVLRGERLVLHEFVENAETALAYKSKAKKEADVDSPTISKDELLKLRVFDFLIREINRHGGNYLIKDGKIFAIDNELSMQADIFKSRHSTEHFLRDIFELTSQGSKIPEEVAVGLKKFYSWEEGQNLLRVLLEELVDKESVDEFMKDLLVFVEVITEDGWLDMQKMYMLLSK